MWRTAVRHTIDFSFPFIRTMKIREQGLHVSTRFYATNFLLEGFEEVEESVSSSRKVGGGGGSMSLAKSLACLTDETAYSEKRTLTRMEHKKLIELRIKKRVKAQFRNGKYYDLVDNVIANVNTLSDSYDIIRLNSNVELGSIKDDVCFASLTEQLATGTFDMKLFIKLFQRSRRREVLVLPRLELKIVQEAVRVVLEIVYRPHFSRISHGCRSGRGHHSVVNYVRKEIGNHDWWITVPMNKEANSNIISKLLSDMKEHIEDPKLLSLIDNMFKVNALNLVFGGFSKGQGLPQEGVLSPILMNIYLDNLDREILKISLKYEGLGSVSDETRDAKSSKLRSWMRRSIEENETKNDLKTGSMETRISACRYMDEILIMVSGSEEVARTIKSEILSYVNKSLYLDVNERIDMSEIRSNCRGLQFGGVIYRLAKRDTPALRAVHKLKDKMRLFASQKEEIWDALTLRIGKKWLAYGLRRLKESEIKNLGLGTPLLDHISQFRKDGMKTDHWFKTLLKVWMQNTNAKKEANEETLLSKYIAEPALPQDLIDSFYNFQKQAELYISTEKAIVLDLVCSSGMNSSSSAGDIVTRLEAPINYIKKILNPYGLVNIEGFPRHVSVLVLQDDDLIIKWFSGLVSRWLKWYSEFDNFDDIKPLIVDCVRKSCIRTLAAKYRMYEVLIEKKFDLELSNMPMMEDLDNNTWRTDTTTSGPDNDEALMYGILNSGLCVLSLSRVKVPARKFTCFVTGCMAESPSMYSLHVKEMQRFPSWKTGFSTCIHLSLNGRRVGLCSNHVKDLYLGHISLQSIEFGALSR